MANRERKRAERRKRKARATATPAEAAPGTSNGERGADEASPIARGYTRSEERNRQAREALEPLHEAERPRAVTIGALVSALIATIFWASAGVALLSDATVNGKHPSPVALAAFALILTAMAVGMWRARYWAVLGFQMLLGLFILSATVGLVQAGTALQAAGTTLLIALLGTLFFFMVKAMARIQMPQRLPRE